ncbi:MAG TPA: hypothetical protein VHX38_21570 [Pseudonocardiaceae bacterium]|nr:hypothetical protein [Pseudonocardiaceae bacterium]
MALSANGFFDNPTFDEASALAGTASRYPGSPSLSTDAVALRTIADSDQTSVGALAQATPDIASLCGHPFGFGTTDFDTGGSGSDEQAGGAPDNGGSDGSGSDSDSGSGSDGGSADGSDGSSGDGSGDGSGNGGQQGDAGGSGVTSGQPATTEAPAGVGDEASAQAALQQEVDNDRPAVEALVGSWVAQLSSKTYGMTVDGTTYDYLQIWNDFESISEQNPAALLLWSGDYSSFLLPNYWVTIMPTAYSTGEQANSWCSSDGLTAQTCYAKLISHTAGPTGSTLIP